MTRYDRQLADLIADLGNTPVGCFELRELVETYGAARLVRVITDGTPPCFMPNRKKCCPTIPSGSCLVTKPPGSRNSSLSQLSSESCT